MNTMINITNTGSIKALRQTVKNLNSAVQKHEKTIHTVSRQRNENRIHEVAWANTARTLAKKLGIDFEEVKEGVFKTALEKTQKDFEKRGLEPAYKHPPKFTVKM